jgi:ketosteroid isomerase-like protein
VRSRSSRRPAVTRRGHSTSSASTAILTNTDDIWAVSVATIAAQPSGKQIKSEAKQDAVVPPGATAPGKVDPNAQGAVDAFQKGLLDQQAWGDDLGSRSDSLVVGVTAGDVTRGKKDIKKLWKARVRSNVRMATNGEVTAQVTPDGQIAWVTAPVTRAADDEDPMPLRVFAVYEKAGDGWKMIALHEAVAFDSPGSGAPFKKIVPAAPKPVVEPVKPKTADETKKKKKKKKKKPKTDDDS